MIKLNMTTPIGCLDKMKKNANRMRVLSVYDLSKEESLRALRRLRSRSHPEVEPDSVLSQVYHLVGGRTSYLARVARAPDMLGGWLIEQLGINIETKIHDADKENPEEANSMIMSEKAWLLSK